MANTQRNFMLIQYKFQLNIIFLLCKALWNFHRVKSLLNILGEQWNFQGDIISSRFKPWLGMTIMVFTAGSQRDQTQPGEWIRSKLLCFVNPAVPKERGESNSFRTSTIFRSGMGLVLDPRWYAAITGSLYHTHRHTVACVYTYTPSTPMYTHTHYISVSHTETPICSHTHGQLCEIP